MKVSTINVVALAVASVQAAVVSRAACPAAWTQVSQDLTKLFVGSDGQCTDMARAAIRAVFHDCATWAPAQGTSGGCDGSIYLSAEENARNENRGLQAISATMKALATSRGVGVADLIVFAGAHATVSCPLGPTVKTMIGRTDSSKAAPDESLLPSNASMDASSILSLMSDKGFSAPDVAALIGAHSSAKQFLVDPSKAGTPQDRTPGIWDVDYYSDTTTKPAGVFVFQSDLALSQDSRSGPTFQSFVGQQATWNTAFADSFARLMLLGVPTADLVDCTAALPAPQDSFAGANLPASSAPAASAASSVATRSVGMPSLPAGFPTPSVGGFPKAPTGAPPGFPKLFTSAISSRPTKAAAARDD